jgi:hypothetical protein
LILLNPSSDEDADSNKEKMKLRKEVLAKAVSFLPDSSIIIFVLI